MARIPGVPAEQAGWLQRFTNWYTRRMRDAELEPVAIMAQRPWVLGAYDLYEGCIARASSVDPKLKGLVSLKAAALVGCVF
jgi:hypothetical protein